MEWVNSLSLLSPEGGGTHFLDAGPDAPLNEDPGEAGHAEEEGDGQQDVGNQAKQHWAPVDLSPHTSNINPAGPATTREWRNYKFGRQAMF